MAERRGRPLIGAAAGLLLGLAVAVDLLLLGQAATNAPILLILPVVGLILGIAVGRTSPLARFRGERRDRPTGGTS